MHHRKIRLLIAISGMDGTGKTTLALSLTKALNRRGIPVKYVWTRFEPWLVSIPWRMMQLVLKKNKMHYSNYSLSKRSLLRAPFFSNLFLYSLLIDYWIQIQIKVNLPLKFGGIVICDRYFYDTLVDLAIDMGYVWPQTNELLGKFRSLIPSPDLIIILDLSAEEAFRRKTDTPSLGYLLERRDLFLSLGSKLNAVIVSADVDKAEIHALALKHMEDCIDRNKSHFRYG